MVSNILNRKTMLTHTNASDLSSNWKDISFEWKLSLDNCKDIKVFPSLVFSCAAMILQQETLSFRETHTLKEKTTRFSWDYNLVRMSLSSYKCSHKISLFFPLFAHFFWLCSQTTFKKKLFISIFPYSCSFHILSILVSSYLCCCARNCRVASFVLSFKTVDVQLLCIFIFFFSHSIRLSVWRRRRRRIRRW